MADYVCEQVQACRVQPQTQRADDFNTWRTRDSRRTRLVQAFAPNRCAGKLRHAWRGRCRQYMRTGLGRIFQGGLQIGDISAACLAKYSAASHGRVSVWHISNLKVARLHLLLLNFSASRIFDRGTDTAHRVCSPQFDALSKAVAAQGDGWVEGLRLGKRTRTGPVRYSVEYGFPKTRVLGSETNSGIGLSVLLIASPFASMHGAGGNHPDLVPSKRSVKVMCSNRPTWVLPNACSVVPSRCAWGEQLRTRAHW